VALLALVLVVAGCAADDSSDDDNGGGGTTITVVAESGTEQALDGTWTVCKDTGSNQDRRDHIVISGDSVQHTDYSYSSTDNTCTGTETVEDELSLTLVDKGNREQQGWSNGSSVVSAPTGVDGSALPDPPTGTVVDILFEGDSVETDVMFMNDNATPVLLYTAQGDPASPCAPVDGFDSCMYAKDPLEKQ